MELPVEALCKEKVISKKILTRNEEVRLGGLPNDGVLRGLRTRVIKEPGKLRKFANVLRKVVTAVPVANNILKECGK